MENTLHKFFSGFMQKGQLTITYPSGRTETYGPGPDRSHIRFADEEAMKAVARDPVLKIGEMYMDGRLICEEGDIYDFITVTKRNGNRRAITPWAVLHHLRRAAIAGLRRRTGMAEARRNIAHHYDIDERLYRLFLDPDLNYTCAYFEHDDQGLEEAQLAKQRHIAGKLLSKPGAKAIDLGCGWGGMGLYLNEVAGLDVTGVTLSAEQARVAKARAEARGVADRCTFKNLDYREAQGQYDHVVSIGLLEHVGLPQMDTFFKKVSSLLDKQGTAVIHSMGQTKPALYAQPFGEKYIFPGGIIPALSQVLPSVERAGLLVRDVEILPLHYARTCRLWRERFMANRDKVLEIEGFDERFVRMWEIYLAASEASFRHDRIFVFHLILSKHQDRVPIRRDWLETEKERLRAEESDRPSEQAATAAE